MDNLSLLEQFSDGLIAIYRSDPRVVSVVADGLNSSRLLEISEAFPDRVFQVGIAEQGAVGTAVGLAYEGHIPMVFSYCSYLLPRAFEQIRNHVAINGIRLFLVGTHAGVSGYNAGDRSFEDLALARSIDNLRIYTPSDGFEIRDCLNELFASPSSAYIRLPNTKPDFQVDLSLYGINVGTKFRLRKLGERKCIVAYGFMLERVLDTFKNSTFAILSCLNSDAPLDLHSQEFLSQYEQVYFVEDHKRHGSLFQCVLSDSREIFMVSNAHFIGVPDNFLAYGSRHKLVEALGVDSVSLWSRVGAD